MSARLGWIFVEIAMALWARVPPGAYDAGGRLPRRWRWLDAAAGRAYAAGCRFYRRVA